MTHFFKLHDDVIYFIENVKQELNDMFSELDVPFSRLDILKGISDLNLNKSGGPDRILNEFLIHGKNVLAGYFLNLFNKLLYLGYFPKKWSEGLIVPIHKKRKSVGS